MVRGSQGIVFCVRENWYLEERSGKIALLRAIHLKTYSHATLVLSPPTLTFSCASRCVAGSTQGRSWPRVQLISSVFGQPNPTLVVLSSPFSAAALFVSKAKILLGHEIRGMLLRLLLMTGPATSASVPWSPSTEVSQPYKSTTLSLAPRRSLRLDLVRTVVTSPNDPRRTRSRGIPFGDVTKFRAKLCDREENAWVLGCAALIFDSKTLNLVMVISAVDSHTGFSIVNAFLAFSMRAWMPSLTWLIKLPFSQCSSIFYGHL